MDNLNIVVRKTGPSGISFPAGIFAYFSMCERLRNKNESKLELDCPNNLPHVSSITNQFTPQEVIHAQFSFLKYAH